MPTKHEITLNWPHMSLWPNRRIDRRKATPHRRAARDEGFALTRKAVGASGLKNCKVHVHMHFCPPDNRRRDLDNMFAACKSHRDGISDAIKVDDSKWTLSMTRGEVRQGGAVIATVEVL